MENYFEPKMDPAGLGNVSSLGLAHVGDGVYELLVRTYLCTHGTITAKTLHKETVLRVTAPAQARVMDLWLPELSEEELAVYKRARNAHVSAVPKNATPGEYAKATGLEALLGYLYLSGRQERIGALFALAVQEVLHAT